MRRRIISARDWSRCVERSPRGKTPVHLSHSSDHALNGAQRKNSHFPIKRTVRDFYPLECVSPVTERPKHSPLLPLSDRCPSLIAHYWHICPNARKRECTSMSTSLFLTITMMVHLFYVTPRLLRHSLTAAFFYQGCWKRSFPKIQLSYIIKCAPNCRG